MMPIIVNILLSVVILASPVKLAQIKDINNGGIEHGGILPDTITGSEVKNSSDDDASLGVETNSYKDSGTEHKDVGIVNGNETKGDDGVQSINRRIDIDGNITLNGGAIDRENQQRTPEDGEGDAFDDEELQQDLPDVWSDTEQLLTGILENPIRIEETPSSSLGIKVGSPSEEEAVECPPPVMLVTPALCGAPACLTHRHCRDPDTACCFNGCVHTCLRPLDAPAVIDWLEDTSLILPMLDEAPGVPRYPMLFEGSSSIAYAQGGGEAVHLQGGCTITNQQYNQLKDYMTRTNIQDCSCTGGEVVCVVKPYKREEE